MSPEERERIRKRQERLLGLPPEKQEVVLRAGRIMRHLGDEMREQLHERMRHMREMPPERRQQMMRKMRSVRQVMKDDFEELRAFGPGAGAAPDDPRQMREEAMRVRMKARVLHMLPCEEIEKLREQLAEVEGQISEGRRHKAAV